MVVMCFTSSGHLTLNSVGEGLGPVLLSPALDSHITTHNIKITFGFDDNFSSCLALSHSPTHVLHSPELVM